MGPPIRKATAFLPGILPGLALAAVGFCPAVSAQAAPAEAGGLPQDEQPEVIEARATLEQARTERGAAFDTLETLILDLRDDYELLTTSARAATTKHSLVLAMHDSLPVARARLSSEEAAGHSITRGVRRRVLSEVFAEPMQRSATVDTRLGDWVAAQVAQELSRHEDLTVLSADDVLAALNGALEPPLTFWEFWNERLRPGRPEVSAYREAVERYEAAGLELNRARFPERYGPRGEVAPPGMVIVPGGHYSLGPSSGWDRPGDRGQTQRVNLKSFAADRTEVTQQAYALFVNALPLAERPALLPRGWVLDDEARAAAPDGLPDHPVVYVSFGQADAYAKWAGKRLPTENEWEATASGSEAFVFPWGNAWRMDMANGDRLTTGVLPVESFPHSRAPTGCYDMVGNVWEWTATRADGSDIDELEDDLVNVIIRGGAWNSDRDKLNNRYRWAAPGHDTFGSPRYTMPIGFRCVQDLR